MKRLKTFVTVGIMALIITSVFHACKKDDSQDLLSRQKSTDEEYKEFYRQGMREALIELKQQFVNYYYSGDYNGIGEEQTFQDFCDEQGYDKGSIPSSCENLLQFVFQCVKNNYDDSFIRENYTGKWIADLFIEEDTYSWDYCCVVLPAFSDILHSIFSEQMIEEMGGMENFQYYCRILTFYPAFAYDVVIIEFGEEELYSELLEGFLSFNNSLKPYFEELPDQNFEGFLSHLEVDESNMEPWGRDLLELSYECLLNDYSDSDIRDHYAPDYTNFMLEATKYLVENPDSDGREVFETTSNGGNYPCKWWQLRCHLTYFAVKQVMKIIEEKIPGTEVQFSWAKGQGTIVITITI